MTAPLTSDYASTPYWWDGVEAPASSGTALPTEVDVAVVGGGYTGLAAAWELARAGRQVVVVEGEEIGRGASGRNGGMVHPGGKLSLPTLLALPGGRALWDDTVAAFEGVEKVVGELGIACDWRRSGHLELADHPRHVAHLRAEAAAYGAIGEEARFLTATELGAEVGSRRFAGGMVVTRSGSVQPVALAGGLATAALGAGAELQGQTEVRAVDRHGAGFRVETSRGTIRAGQVIVATNGTTTRRPVAWLGRRILGIGSFMIATEPIGPEVAAAVSPPAGCSSTPGISRITGGCRPTVTGFSSGAGPRSPPPPWNRPGTGSTPPC